MESFKIRQEDEVQVLQSVYMDEFQDLRTLDVWKTPRPPEIKFLVKPQDSMNAVEAYVQIQMHVKMSERYPDALPTIMFHKAKGLSIENQKTLQKECDSLAKTLRGKEMILDLAQHVQRFLYAYNKPPTSFYEDMVLRERKKQESIERERCREIEEKRENEEKERQNFENEWQRRQEIAKMSRKRRDIETSVDEGALECNVDEKDNECGKSRWSMESVDTCKNPQHMQMTMTFNTKDQLKIYRSKCIAHEHDGLTRFSGINSETGELVSIYEWAFIFDRDKKNKLEINSLNTLVNTYIHKICVIEQEAKSLLKLEHNDLLSYISITHQQHSKRNLSVTVVMKDFGGINLKTYTGRNVPLPINLVHKVSLSLFAAVQFLHQREVVHKDISLQHLMLDAKGNIRLGGFSIFKRLSDLQKEVECHPKEGEGRNPPTNKKKDIYQAGLLLLYLSTGKEELDLHDSAIKALPREFCDFLQRCTHINELERWTADQLCHHSFLKSQLMYLNEEQVKQKGPNIKPLEIDDQSDDSVTLLTPFETSGQSRLTNEFTVLKVLGKGGFGDVIKVKNNLDGQFYAIKRIELNPSQRILIRKITREVKLLSRLNHENVVRYFNAWIDTTDELPCSNEPSSPPISKCKSSKPTADCVGNALLNSPPFAQELHFDTKPIFNCEESGVDNKYDDNNGDDDDDKNGAYGSNCGDEDEEEDDICGAYLPDSDSDDGIIFHRTFDNDKSLSSSSEKRSQDMQDDHGDRSERPVQKLQFLYIQMEYCDKSTLRDCIDSGLHQDFNRVWRFFREILEGLNHIHEKGMIHRDLKPANIFIDANDNIKIGDFGLATTNVLAKSTNLTSVIAAGDSEHICYSDSLGDPVLTGNVGTALYVSPEIIKPNAEVPYTEKVDLYSLGIIFFEMSYPPQLTEMERIKIIRNIRLPSIDLPDSFEVEKMNSQAAIIRWLLNHDPSLRPSSAELLQSDLLPPPQEQELELNEMIRSVVSNPQTKQYRHLVNTMFSQTTSSFNDLTYDMDLVKSSRKYQMVQQYVYDCLAQIFHLHGAVHFNTPLLMPTSSVYDNSDQYVSLLDHSGRIISLPYDLRVPFARYVARNAVTNMKRFSIERVYREKKLFSVHPKEILECAFDIITITDASLPVAEILHVIQEIIYKFPPLKERNYSVRINHLLLLKSILLHCGVAEDQHLAFLDKLAEIQREKQNKSEVFKMVVNMMNSKKASEQLMDFLDMEGPLKKISSSLNRITNKTSHAASLARHALGELETLLKNVKYLEVKMPIIISLGLMYSLKQYSGIFFHVTSKQRYKQRNVVDVLAAGGQYNELIKFYSSHFLQSRSEYHNQAAAGVSFAFDKIATAMFDDQELWRNQVDILVCNIGDKSATCEQLKIAHHLWSHGYCSTLKSGFSTLAELDEYCHSASILYCVILEDNGVIKFLSVDKDKIFERRANNLQGLLDILKQETDACQYTCKKLMTGGQVASDVSQNTSISTKLMLNINFLLESKLPSNTKRKIEAQIYSKLSSTLTWVSNKCEIEVIAADIPPAVVRSVASLLDLSGSKSSFVDSQSAIFDIHPPYRKYLSKIFDAIYNLKFKSKRAPMVIYGYNKQETFKLLI